MRNKTPLPAPSDPLAGAGRGPKPRLLDLFCCAGGIGHGYHLAGFDVTGVDIAPRPNYPHTFIQADAIEYIKAHGHEYDAASASPPCQKHSALSKGTNGNRFNHPDLIAPTRDALDTTGLPYIIENVAGAPIRKDLRLCGEMFGLPLIMHRFFELGGGLTIDQPAHIPHRGRVRGYRHNVFYDGPYLAAYGEGGDKATVAQMQAAKGMPWTSVRKELTEAIPVPYGRFLGDALMAHLREATE